jgi:predicted homoserine dehydrogenase-like protein
VNLHRKLLERAAAGRPIGVGMIGAGKFGTMFLAQARRTPGIHVVGIADLAPDRAKANLRYCGWEDERFAARTLDEAAKSGGTCVLDDSGALLAHPAVEVVIEATGDPKVGIRHCLRAIAERKHIVMVNVEADVVAGPLLARKAREAGVVYSLAYGDQPALICGHEPAGSKSWPPARAPATIPPSTTARPTRSGSISGCPARRPSAAG